MGRQIFTNLTGSTLNNAISAVAVTIRIDDKTTFPPRPMPEGCWFMLTFTDGIEHEIVKVTAMAVSTWSVERGQEGTTARAWPAGTKAEMRLTASALNSMAAAIESLETRLVALEAGT